MVGYTSIEDSGQFKKAVNKKQDFCSLQKRMEYNRKNFFIESEIIKKNSVYFSSEFKTL